MFRKHETRYEYLKSKTGNRYEKSTEYGVDYVFLEDVEFEKETSMFKIKSEFKLTPQHESDQVAGVKSSKEND